MKKVLYIILFFIIISNIFGLQYYTKYQSKVREKPDSKSTVLEIIPVNTYIIILQKTDIYENIDQWKDCWYKTYYNKKFGYIYGALIEGKEKINESFNIDKNYNNKDDYSLFYNEDLKLSFYYPRSWKIEILKEGTMHSAITAQINNNDSRIFLSAVNSKGTMDGRGGYYGDKAADIKNEDYLMNVYKYNFNTVIYNNLNNIKILNINSVEDISMMPEIESVINIFDRFYIYNNKSDYHGVIISYEMLLKNPYSEYDQEYIKLKNEIYYLLNSLKIENKK